MPLTKREYELLEAIVAFGGVVTRSMVQKYWDNISERWAKEMLLNLSDKKYIKHIAGFSPTDQKVYQVTFKACKEFGVGQSHMRKKLHPVTLRRNLLRAHFLFSVTHAEHYGAVSNSGKRIAFLNNHGVDNALMPRKFNKGDAVLQIEEPFLLLPPYAPDGGICVVLVDMIDSEPLHQLRMMVDRYVPIIRSRVIPISFLAVTESKLRGQEYDSLYNKKLLTKDLLKPKMNYYSIDCTYGNYSFDCNSS